MSCPPKIFHWMTQTMILAFKSMGFGSVTTLTLSISLEVEDDYQKSWKS